jgi:hypothetical protein
VERGGGRRGGGAKEAIGPGAGQALGS